MKTLFKRLLDIFREKNLKYSELKKFEKAQQIPEEFNFTGWLER